MRQLSLRGFRSLYHAWAWAYDGVASFVSLGRWYSWVGTVQPYLIGPRILEIGPGTGHLLEMLAATPALRPLGLDESRQMLRLARNRCANRVPLVRAVVERLPLKAAAFDTAVATFPPIFIREVSAMRELRRVLRPGGRLVIVPTAQLVGLTPLERLVARSLALIGGAPHDSRGAVSSAVLPVLEQAGFLTELHEVRSPASLVFVIVATKAGHSP